MKIFTIIFIFLSNLCFSQFKIVIDETFSLKIQAAIEVIRETDATSYVIVNDYCDKILISADTIPTSNDGIINIPLKVVAGTSLNLIASTIVRESYKLRLEDIALQLNPRERELLCFDYEKEFRQKLPKEYGTTMKDKFRKFVNSKNSIQQQPISENFFKRFITKIKNIFSK